MQIISHRGNLNGPNPDKENTIEYVVNAHQYVFDVEIDIRSKDGKLFLGHDKPIEEVSPMWLLKNHDWLWCHAKDVETLQKLLGSGMRCFFHDGDEATLTSTGVIWMHANAKPVTGCVWVVLDFRADIGTWNGGVCTDYPLKYYDLYY